MNQEVKALKVAQDAVANNEVDRCPLGAPQDVGEMSCSLGLLISTRELLLVSDPLVVLVDLTSVLLAGFLQMEVNLADILFHRLLLLLAVVLVVVDV
ncbi:uncharacterized protein PG986_004679 [Apiospora aurea]|uniref:Uncharacterized protein n=1 Tax=Apiospora aurea TaxID=335848 RepID=A0ABR1QN99_9PEZI